MDKKTLQFLDDLRKNNNRDWFNENKERFLQEKDKSLLFFSQVARLLDKEDEFNSLKMYRIYRDIRFSKDKTPYKNHFSAVYLRKQPFNRGSFYIHIEPNNSFVGGGFWNPSKEDLLRIRKAIEVEEDLQEIVSNDVFKKVLGKIEGESLKTTPKGFDKEHPRIELLRHKQFLLMKRFTDEQVLSPNFKKKIIEVYHVMRPFFLYMTDVLTTDENGELIV
ncbi:MAG: DUF2461 domain-containing protein [Brumimicrobium sp.]